MPGFGNTPNLGSSTGVRVSRFGGVVLMAERSPGEPPGSSFTVPTVSLSGPASIGHGAPAVGLVSLSEHDSIDHTAPPGFDAGTQPDAMPQPLTEASPAHPGDPGSHLGHMGNHPRHHPAPTRSPIPSHVAHGHPARRRPPHL